MRSTFGMRLTGLLFVALALALGGCGTVSEGLQTSFHTPPLDVSRTAVAGEAAPLETRLAGAGHIENLMTAAAAPAEERHELPEKSPSGTETPATKPTAPGFVPVALEPLPSGSLGLFVVADQKESPTEAETTAKATAAQPDLEELEEYDPWEKFNEKMFTFNYNFDKYILKPVAKVYNFIVPDIFQQMIGRGFDNIQVIPKLVNNILQWNWKGFSIELGRFAINTTLGIGGLFDIARQEFGIEKTRVDFGQTLGKWGAPPGPFLILPFMTPMTVRDGIGNGVDGAMDIMGYFVKFFPDRLAMRLGSMINDRSLNLDLFQGFEETTVDMYSAVRNGYLQRRYNLIHNRP